MSADTSQTTTGASTGAHDEAHDDAHHPTPRQYVEVAIVLAVLTAMEVAASFVDIGRAFLPTLIGLMTIKFILVAGWFMHLKYDTRLYTRLMVTGLLLALGLYAVVLMVFSTAIRA